jgi:hypothetical protein
MNKINNLILLLIFSLFFTPLISFAEEAVPTFVPLVGIPGVNADADFGTYINALYTLSISLAALLAVIKIVIAGVKWMLTDSVSGIGNAKEDIKGALIGLLIIISAVVVLNFVNPKLTSTDIFLEPVNSTSTQSKPSKPTIDVVCLIDVNNCRDICINLSGTPIGEPYTYSSTTLALKCIRN